jgi:uncharacterized membrane protein
MPAFYPGATARGSTPPTEQTLAGQPQEPSWRTSEQDQTRPAPSWQPQVPPSSDQQDSYAYPQTTVAPGYNQSYPPPDQSYPQSGQGYPQSGQGYPGPSYGAPDGAYNPQDASFPGAGAGADQGYPGPQGQGSQQWQAAASSAMNSRAAGHAKGFIGSLFDFSFTSFVTPKIVKVLYVLITVWTVLWALIFLRYGFKYGGAVGGFFVLLIVDPILILLTLGVYRVVLELFMVVHRMHDDLKAIRDRDSNQV